ncbi:lipoprotein [Myxococcus stipitatus DSM 14675]|uniref:Lipoprotein n=1 Tax=Myxococcus stipitatus (strain DSM 14675 / JCM 12634 / Mx s8) TaxID=1278073 RepID=L7U2K1_MYXSD|nr:hypothetical protein [Myxococcus stipitatus]AGC42050.1 lipoprotein [Myxococcus stipitatus DSM 14675]
MRSRGDMMKSSLLVALCVLLASGCGGAPTADGENGGDPQAGGLEGSTDVEGNVDPVSGEGAGRDKVTVCHIPPGNPANAHTITVGAPAVKAHLKHGDTLGACGSEQDGGSAPDAGTEPDGGGEPDAGEPDAGSPPDAGTSQDAGSPTDAGVCLPVDSDCGPSSVCCQGLSCSSAGLCEPHIG